MSVKSKSEDPEKILQSIREKDKINYDAFVNLYAFFSTNSGNLADLNILDGITSLSVGDEGVQEKELAMAEKRINLMTKFSEKYDYYLKTLNALRADLSKEDVKKAEDSVEFKTKTGLSVEERMKNRKK